MIALNANEERTPFAADWKEGIVWRRPSSDGMPFLLLEQPREMLAQCTQRVEWSADHYRVALVLRMNNISSKSKTLGGRIRLLKKALMVAIVALYTSDSYYIYIYTHIYIYRNSGPHRSHQTT